MPSPGDPPDPGIEPRSHRKYSVIANYYDNYNHEVSKIPYLILISAKLSLRKQTCSNTDFQIFKTRTYGKELWPSLHIYVDSLYSDIFHSLYPPMFNDHKSTDNIVWKNHSNTVRSVSYIKNLLIYNFKAYTQNM